MADKVEFKICGLSTEDTVKAAVESGAFMIGLVLYEPSARSITLKRARELAIFARKLNGDIKIVAMTVNGSDSELKEIVEYIKPDMIQLHGNESVERTEKIRNTFALPVIKAVGISTSSDLATANEYQAVADWILFDAKPPTELDLPGGNGLPFEWNTLSGVEMSKPFLLSGGLDKDNVEKAIRITKPNAVDVSSGVEVKRGMKDLSMIREFGKVVQRMVIDESSGNAQTQSRHFMT